MTTGTETGAQRCIILLLRLMMAWTFLYAASQQVFVPNWSAVGFLEHTKTFHWIFVYFTGATIGPVMSFLVKYGHLLIGLSLLTGAFLRAGSIVGLALMILYWMAHMDFPYISNTNNFLVDSHLVYAAVLLLLIVSRAGHYVGLDSRLSGMSFIKNNRLLFWATN